MITKAYKLVMNFFILYIGNIIILYLKVETFDNFITFQKRKVLL